MIEDIADPDRNGLPRVLEEAHGVSPGEDAAPAALGLVKTENGLRLGFQQATSATDLQVEFEEACLPDGPRAVLETVSNATDQSGLPEGVVRREATVTTDAQSAFYRISMRVVPPPQ